MSTPTKPPPHEPIKPEPIAGVRLTESTRVEAFSDAVMAIVITRLVLELRAPTLTQGEHTRPLPSLTSAASLAVRAPRRGALRQWQPGREERRGTCYA